MKNLINKVVECLQDMGRGFESSDHTYMNSRTH